MQLNSYLVKSRHGIYYLRVQRNGVDKRVSLRTRDPFKAKVSAYKFGVFMANNEFGFDFSNISKWEVKTKEFEIKTDGTDKDNADGLKALALLLAHTNQNLPTLTQTTNLTNKPLNDAVSEYKIVLANTKLADKTKSMAMSKLDGLIVLLGATFDMSLINDQLIEEKWIPFRQLIVKDTTVKRDLSFVKMFIKWASDPKRKYCPAPLTITFDAVSDEHYEYLDAQDLKLIFDEIPKKAQNAWQFWIPLIGLYTGARISEPASMLVENVFNKSGLDVMHLPGTKTDTSPRDIPIHSDLIALGFIDYAVYRKSLGKEMLFDVTFSKKNGYGGAPSKWFSAFKFKIGITHKKKTFHSFRHTITDILNQHNCTYEANCQYTGHSKGGGVKGRVYGRKLLNLMTLKTEVLDKIDWNKYCAWSPDLIKLKVKAQTFVPINNSGIERKIGTFVNDELLKGQT